MATAQHHDHTLEMQSLDRVRSSNHKEGPSPFVGGSATQLQRLAGNRAVTSSCTPRLPPTPTT